MTRQAAVVGAIVCSLLAAGCRKQEEAPTREQPSTQPASEMPSGTETIPPALQQAEGLTEDIQDSINAGNWSGAEKMVTKLQTASTQLRSTHAKKKEVETLDTAIASLARDVKSRNRLAADTSANRAAFATISMMASYHPRIPVAVGFMDVAARDAMYKAELGDWHGVDKASSDLSKHYSSVSHNVKSKNATLDTNVKAQLDALKNAAKAKNASQVKATSTTLLEDIDRIEQTF